MLGNPGIVPSTAPASIPIFVMRPLRGQLEQATQNAVTKLRADGDKAVFWLDTSGWLNPNIDDTDLAGVEEKCAFLPHEVYQGKGLDQEEARFDKYIEDEKERKLKQLFWEDEDTDMGEVPED